MTNKSDEFSQKDDFKRKSEIAFNNLDKHKIIKALIILGLIISAVVFAVYFKLKKNDESRIQAGIETAVAKPVTDENDLNNTGINRFGFDTPQEITPKDLSVSHLKSPEQLEVERQLIEQQKQFEMQQEQAKQELLNQQKALLNARYKSSILVSEQGQSQSGMSLNGENSIPSIPPELAPLFMGMQASQQTNDGANVSNSRIENNSASSLGGRFNSSSQKAPISQASYNADRRMLIQQGKVIDAVLETAVKSDLPSNIIARVVFDVYSEQGRNRLLPAGTRLFGQYSSIVNDGQAEIAAIWNRAITPNGVEIMLDSPSTNGLGIAGLGGKVNNHYGRIFGTATLLSLIGAGVSNVGVNDNAQNNASQSYRSEVSKSFGNQADRVLQRNLSIPPTITVEHGARIKVLVAKDLDFSTIFNQ